MTRRAKKPTAPDRIGAAVDALRYARNILDDLGYVKTADAVRQALRLTYLAERHAIRNHNNHGGRK